VAQLINLEEIFDGLSVKITYGDHSTVEGLCSGTDYEDVSFWEITGEQHYDTTDVAVVEVTGWPTWLTNLVGAANAGSLGEGEIIRVIAAALGRSVDAASHLWRLVREAVV